MKQELEKDIQKTILDFLKLKGLHANKINTVGIKKPNGSFIPSQNVGMADIIGLTKSGRYFAIEVKRKGGKMTDAQRDFQLTVQANRGIGITATCLEDIIDCKDLWK